jgi:hypothetical protein
MRVLEKTGGGRREERGAQPHIRYAAGVSVKERV